MPPPRLREDKTHQAPNPLPKAERALAVNISSLPNVGWRKLRPTLKCD